LCLLQLRPFDHHPLAPFLVRSSLSIVHCNCLFDSDMRETPTKVYAKA
jgi:hypothetical protein